eukprot:735122-Rhodomonas_salina.1
MAAGLLRGQRLHGHYAGAAAGLRPARQRRKQGDQGGCLSQLRRRCPAAPQPLAHLALLRLAPRHPEGEPRELRAAERGGAGDGHQRHPRAPAALRALCRQGPPVLRLRVLPPGGRARALGGWLQVRGAALVGLRDASARDEGSSPGGGRRRAAQAH